MSPIMVRFLQLELCISGLRFDFGLAFWGFGSTGLFFGQIKLNYL